jgi:putative FmdB family regulatory protein
MPTYEYQCADCKHVWELREHIAEHTQPHSVRCPQCGGEHVEQLLTQFFAKTSRKS